MAQAKETAEEQLLRMIEGPGSRPGRQQGLRGVSLERATHSLKEGLEAVKQWGRKPRRRREETDIFLWQLRIAERIFWLILAALATYLVVDTWFVEPKKLKFAISTDSAPITGSVQSADATMQLQLKRAAEYQQALATHNPFRLSPDSTIKPSSQTAKNRLIELTETLMVVGINRGAVPEALIEDKTNQRTYFVKVGDVVNSLTVTSIDQEGVRVSYEGEEVLLQ